MIDVTKMSTRGQVVIPESIRKKFKLRPGTCFQVEGAFYGTPGTLTIFLNVLKEKEAAKQIALGEEK